MQTTSESLNAEWFRGVWFYPSNVELTDIGPELGYLFTIGIFSHEGVRLGTVYTIESIYSNLTFMHLKCHVAQETVICDPKNLYLFNLISASGKPSLISPNSKLSQELFLISSPTARGIY